MALFYRPSIFDITNNDTPVLFLAVFVINILKPVLSIRKQFLSIIKVISL